MASILIEDAEPGTTYVIQVIPMSIEYEDDPDPGEEIPEETKQKVLRAVGDAKA